MKRNGKQAKADMTEEENTVYMGNKLEIYKASNKFL